jgi:hypothetical protein
MKFRVSGPNFTAPPTLYIHGVGYFQWKYLCYSYESLHTYYYLYEDLLYEISSI